ncbi:MAG: tetratricopeptide repeat protein, partial [Isosphaeraceae bacterium]
SRRPLTTAVNPSRFETLANWGRRNRRRFVLGGLLATAIPLGGFFVHMKTQSDRERNRNEAMQCVTRGASFASRGRWDEAHALYERAKRLDPTLHQPYSGLGDIAFHRDDFPSAFQHLSRAIKIVEAKPSGATASEHGPYHLGRAATSLRWGVKCLEQPDKDHVEARSHFTQALRDLARAWVLDQDSLTCRRVYKDSGYIEMLLGNEESRQNRYDESIGHYDRAVKLLVEAVRLNPEDQETARYLKNAKQCLKVDQQELKRQREGA